MNTRIEYMYRDGSNYKTYGVAVLEGMVPIEEVRLVTSVEYFLPEQVGLETLQEQWDSHYEDDHIWHELCELEYTEQAPTVELTAAEFVARWKAAVEAGWDEAAANKRLQGWVESTPEGH